MSVHVAFKCGCGAISMSPEIADGMIDDPEGRESILRAVRDGAEKAFVCPWCRAKRGQRFTPADWTRLTSLCQVPSPATGVAN